MIVRTITSEDEEKRLAADGGAVDIDELEMDCVFERVVRGTISSQDIDDT